MGAPAGPEGARQDSVPAQVHLFIGKGGVGKTTCSAATALRLAEAGDSSLVISTDPTPSLSHIFEIQGAHREREVLPRLFLTELGMDDVRGMWDERFGREVFSVFSAFVDVDYDTFAQFAASVLPGLNEEFMVDYVRRLAYEHRYRHIVWDTAPLGQTLALLGVPSMLSEHLRGAPRVYARLRASGEGRESIMTVIRRWQQLADACIGFLRESVSISLVAIPEALAVQQLDGAVAELNRYGLAVARLIVNNVVQAADSPFLEQKARQQRPQLERLRERFRRIPVLEIPLFAGEVRGIARLREVGRRLGPAPAAGAAAETDAFRG